MLKRIFSILGLFVSGCLGVPEGIQPVHNFELNRYLGTWYEVARLDHSFEQDLNQVTANYSLRDDGGVKVINRGFNKSTNEWKESEGKAYFVEDETVGHLKVSFFGPFYGSYIVFELDKDNYQYAFVTGSDKSYLWLLSRSKTGNESLLARFIERAKFLGYETDKLIFVEHDTIKQ